MAKMTKMEATEDYRYGKRYIVESGDGWSRLKIGPDNNHVKLLDKLSVQKTMDACESLGIQFIEIPLVGNSALSDNADHQNLIRQLANLEIKQNSME